MAGAGSQGGGVGGCGGGKGGGLEAGRRRQDDPNATTTPPPSYGWNRVGVVVMLLLDPADVPLQAAKMMKYLAESKGKAGVWYQTAADRLL